MASRTLLNISLMVLGAACVLLLTGGFPLYGAPSIYKSGGMLLIGVLAAVLTLWGALRLSRGKVVHLILGGIFCYLTVAGVAAAFVFGKQAILYAAQGGPMWFAAVAYGCKVVVGLIFAGLFGFFSYKLMTRRLWLAMAHLSLFLIALGAYLDFALEKRAQLILPANGALVESVRTTEGEDLALGFKLGVHDFKVEHYQHRPYYLFTREAQQWTPQELAQKGNTLSLRGESWEIPADAPEAFLADEVAEDAEMARFIKRGEPTVKSYEARCELHTKKGTREEFLRINEPITLQGWQISLMSYTMPPAGHAGISPRVVMQARYAPGRVWALAGMVGLIISCAAWCWWRKDESPLQGEEVPA